MKRCPKAEGWKTSVMESKKAIFLYYFLKNRFPTHVFEI